MYQKLEAIIKKLNINQDTILKAFEFASKAHENQRRIEGSPYISHPLEVATILAEMNLDTTTIVAGLLHDVIEDTEYNYSDIKDLFGEQVAIIVEGVSKLDKINYKTKEEAQADNIRKMLLAMTKDIRVILIKLADRLHNMRTLKYLSPEKQIEKSSETLNIFVPLAHRLGISKIKWELEDLSFRYLNPEKYYEIANLVDQKRDDREKATIKIINDFDIIIKQAGINSSIEGRPKHLYSIYKKIVCKGKSIEDIFDLIAIRVIVDHIKDCYLVLGLAHERYTPISNKFKDYIAVPKSNNYQSLHTTVMGNNSNPFEIQIRTKEMHKVAELGIAAHFKYKENKKSNDDFDEKFVWIREVVDWLTETENPSEIVEDFKMGLIFKEIFIFTPKGKVISLPLDSTPVDVAFRIHTDIGYKCEGAKVNGKMVSLDFKLKTGDIVEILTSKHLRGPNLDWLNFVKSNHAKSKIKYWFNKTIKEDNVYKGKHLLERESKKKEINFGELLNREDIDTILRFIGFNNIDNLYESVGIGNISPSIIISKIIDIIIDTENCEKKDTFDVEKLNKQLIQRNDNLAIRERKQKHKKDVVLIKGEKNMLTKFAKCCTPVYGDSIIGFITKGRGVSIHRKNCRNVIKCTESERLLEATWYESGNKSFEVDLCISIANANSSIIEEVVKAINSQQIYLRSINFKETDFEISRIDVRVSLDSIKKLDKIILILKKIRGCIDVYRPNTSNNIVN